MRAFLNDLDQIRDVCCFEDIGQFQKLSNVTLVLF